MIPLVYGCSTNDASGFEKMLKNNMELYSKKFVLKNLSGNLIDISVVGDISKTV